MEKVRFPHRAGFHRMLLEVIGASGSWERYGLEVDFSSPIGQAEAHAALAKGEVEFVDGNHITPYPARAEGDRWVYLAQSTSLFNPKLALAPGRALEDITDLQGQTIAVHRGEHRYLAEWLYLIQNDLNPTRGDVALKTGGREHWQLVVKGEAEAAFVIPPEDLFARRAGLQVMELKPLPMIWFVTVSTTLGYVLQHEDTVRRFLQGLCAGIHFFKTRREETVDILLQRCGNMGITDREVAEHVQAEWSRVLESKPYPTMDAIRNVYEFAKLKDSVATEVNPLSLWDLHYLRQLEDEGFFEELAQAEAQVARR